MMAATQGVEELRTLAVASTRPTKISTATCVDLSTCSACTTEEEREHRQAQDQVEEEEDDGGFDHFWRDKPPAKLICSICLCVVKEPYKHTGPGAGACGQRFCLVCITKYKRFNELCPLCRGLLDISRDDSVVKDILELTVNCDNVMNGCKWFGVLQDLGDHLAKDCLQAYTICPKECCNNGLVAVLRKNKKSHLKWKCPKRNEPDVVRLVLNVPNNSSSVRHNSDKEQLSTSTRCELPSIMAVGESDQESSDLVFPQFPASVVVDHCVANEDDHSHLPLCAPSFQCHSEAPQPFSAYSDCIRPEVAHTQPQQPFILRVRSVFAHDYSHLIRICSQSQVSRLGNLSLVEWVRSGPSSVQVWRLCVGLVQYKLAQPRLSSQCFQATLIDDNGNAFIPSTQMISIARNPDPIFVTNLGEIICQFLELSSQSTRSDIERIKLKAFAQMRRNCSDSYFDALLVLGAVKHRTEPI